MKKIFFVLFIFIIRTEAQNAAHNISASVKEKTDEREGYRKIVRDNLNHFKECLKLGNTKKLKSKKIITQWQVDDQGAVRFSKTKESTFKNISIDNCIANKIKTLSFPAAKAGQLINITYTIDLD